jgi:hypothetical protein
MKAAVFWNFIVPQKKIWSHLKIKKPEEKL